MGQIIEPRHFIDRQWAGTDQAHFTFEDVKNLRPLINAELAEKFADRSDARVIRDFEDGAGHLIKLFQFLLTLLGIADHGAELEHREGLAMQAGPLLTEEDWTWRRALHQEGEHQEQVPAEEKQKGSSTNHVHAALDGTLKGNIRRGLKNEHGTLLQLIQRHAREAGFKKVSHEPGFESFQFTSLNGFLDFTRIGVPGVDDNARGGMLVEQMCEPIHGVGIEIQFADNFDAFLRLAVQFLAEFAGIVR